MQTIALFDLDGVIVDTEGQYTLFWEKVGKRDFPKRRILQHVSKDTRSSKSLVNITPMMQKSASR